MAIRLNLNRRPLYHTLSKTLLMSQNITLISFPLSTAFAKVLYISMSWLTAESFDVKPDW